jgi:hypothetical protein
MLDLPLLPDEVELQVSGRRGDKFPVFVCRPLSLAETVEASNEAMLAEKDHGSPASAWLKVFKNNCLRVPGLKVAGAPFDLKDKTHQEALGLHVMTDIGSQLYYRNALTETEAGK